MNLLCSSAKSRNDVIMMPDAPVLSFHCCDIGMDCSFEAYGSTKTELMRKFIDHAESVHNMQVLSPDIILNLHNAIVEQRFR